MHTPTNVAAVRFFFIVWFTVALAASAGCGTETESTAPESPTTVADRPTSAVDDSGISADQSSSATTSLAPTTTVTSSITTVPTTVTTLRTTTSAAPTTTTTTVPTTTTPTTTTATEPAAEAIGGYRDWDVFWSVFSKAAASGDVATIDALTADEMTFVYAGGGISLGTGPKEDFIGTFARPQEVFEEGRKTLADGTAFRAELLAPGQWSSFHQLGVDYDIAYSVMTEEGDGGPASANEYIFRSVDGEFLFVGYSADS